MIGDRRTKVESEIKISLEGIKNKKGHRGKIKIIRTKDIKIDNGKCKKWKNG